MQNKDAIAILKAQISANASRRIREASEDLTRPKILHTQYLGDRTVQQLGQEPVENAVILNNAANTIGDALMPLAKGSPLQRFDSFNQDDGVGTAKRSLLDNDANRNGSNFVTLRTGEQEPANDPLKGTPRGRDPLPKDYPPPFGCVPLYPAKQCIWIPQSTSPSGYQSHGSAVINEEGLELWLHCQDGVIPPPDLGCTFLARWKCVDGVCTQDPNGTYSTKVACEAARIPVNFTGGQCANVNYRVRATFWVMPVAQPEAIFQIELTPIGKGAVKGIFVETSTDSTGRNEWWGVVEFADSRYRYGLVGGHVTLASRTSGVKNITITRVDGQPDTCGDRYACG